MDDLKHRVAQELKIDPERLKVWTDEEGRLRVDLRMPEGTKYLKHVDGGFVPRLPPEFEEFVRVVESLMDDPKDVVMSVVG